MGKLGAHVPVHHARHRGWADACMPSGRHGRVPSSPGPSSANFIEFVRGDSCSGHISTAWKMPLLLKCATKRPERLRLTSKGRTAAGLRHAGRSVPCWSPISLKRGAEYSEYPVGCQTTRYKQDTIFQNPESVINTEELGLPGFAWFRRIEVALELEERSSGAVEIDSCAKRCL